MEDEDFMQSIIKEGDGQISPSQNKSLELIKKLNLSNRWTILIDNPLEQLSGTFSKAFEVNDQKQKDGLFAKILPASIPIRFEVIEQLKSFHSNHFTNIVDSGLTGAGGGDYGSYALIMEKPKGIKLSQYIRILKEQQKIDQQQGAQKEVKSIMPENVLMDELVGPINEILRNFSENNISHGGINHETIYFNEDGDYRFVITDPVSEPCGYSQSVHFEPVHRACAMPYGKGLAKTKDDYFALGVVIYFCIFGELPSASVPPSEFIKNRVTKGTYNYYAGSAEISSRMADILRGLLTDSRDERWGYEQVSQWVKGKRFNIIRPGLKKDAARSYGFAEVMYPNKKSLAIGYHENWDIAASDIREKKIVKWLEMSAADKDTAADVLSVIGTTGGDRTKSRSDNDELVARVLILLDNDGPIRYRNISCHVDGFGMVLASAWLSQNQNDLQNIYDILKISLLDYKAVRQSEAVKSDRWTLQRQSNYVKFKTLGFGIERILYDLNPTLPCLSSLLTGQFIIDAGQLLYHLNDNSSKLSNHDPVDRHIAAFLASKLELASEVRLKIMNKFRRNEAINNVIVKLALLAFAQKKTRVNKLTGLSVWIADKLKPIINSIHSRDLRKELQEEIKSVAAQGNLEALLNVITGTDIFVRDEEGFNDARATYSSLDAEMKTIKAREKINMSQDIFYLYGLQFSKILAAMVFLATLGLSVL